eukprot:TRINITY_DN5175_c0_g1_i2.p1 TRINITY_DN5175_c0_g1~~TRINITY_DN5175_c0_g1_i2.p1  ORF type:complete len:220 (+),score=27.48 TRINITY_DN5175_c0_g1_i2:452-1111(+)
MTGCPQFSTYSGYSFTFKWTGGCPSPVNKPAPAILAIDAINANAQVQVQKSSIMRDLHKAYIGFSAADDLEIPPCFERTLISTGSWGCGIFGGDELMKLIEQLLASVASGHRVEYSMMSAAARDAVHTLRNAINTKKTQAADAADTTDTTDTHHDHDHGEDVKERASVTVSMLAAALLSTPMQQGEQHLRRDFYREFKMAFLQKLSLLAQEKSLKSGKH